MLAPSKLSSPKAEECFCLFNKALRETWAPTLYSCFLMILSLLFFLIYILPFTAVVLKMVFSFHLLQGVLRCLKPKLHFPHLHGSEGLHDVNFVICVSYI